MSVYDRFLEKSLSGEDSSEEVRRNLRTLDIAGGALGSLYAIRGMAQGRNVLPWMAIPAGVTLASFLSPKGMEHPRHTSMEDVKSTAERRILGGAAIGGIVGGLSVPRRAAALGVAQGILQGALVGSATLGSGSIRRLLSMDPIKEVDEEPEEPEEDLPPSEIESLVALANSHS